MKVFILGAGPTGLGAAYRLNQLNHPDWELWEADTFAGGLASSFTDEHGFTWDVGGHVQFSHYKSFDDLMDEALGPEGWLEHERESWVRIFNTWVPYPFQYNLHRLPKEETLKCLKGLLETQANGNGTHYANFEEMITKVFGRGIGEIFMMPYNYKVWAYPPSDLQVGWIGERVAIPDMGKIAESIVMHKDNVSWGPNNTFRFPKFGGTGAVWRAVAAGLPQERMKYGRKVVSIDTESQTITAEDGTTATYDALISSLPLDILAQLAGRKEWIDAAGLLQYSSTHIIGVGLHGHQSEDLGKKCWMYFPESNCPFYRVTVFSNYSPNNVPDISRYWSLMAEVSQSPKKPLDEARVIEDTVQGMINAGLIENKEQVHHTWHKRIERGYPTPGLTRDTALKKLLPELERINIYSRGRFGAWKYEVSNQDHSYSQGVEAVQRILFGSPELTLWFPNVVNAMHPVYGKDWL